MNRREFVFASFTTAGTAAFVLSRVQADAPLPLIPIPKGVPALFAVIFDQRFAAARTFASAAAWRGNRIFGYSGDLTSVWLQEIEPRWAARAGALAGISTPTALFCLEQLAAQHWLRVVTRIEQPAGSGEALISWIIA
jgi:hypothetical protein